MENLFQSMTIERLDKVGNIFGYHNASETAFWASSSCLPNLGVGPHFCFLVVIPEFFL